MTENVRGRKRSIIYGAKGTNFVLRALQVIGAAFDRFFCRRSSLLWVLLLGKTSARIHKGRLLLHFPESARTRQHKELLNNTDVGSDS